MVVLLLKEVSVKRFTVVLISILILLAVYVYFSLGYNSGTEIRGSIIIIRQACKQKGSTVSVRFEAINKTNITFSDINAIYDIGGSNWNKKFESTLKTWRNGSEIEESASTRVKNGLEITHCKIAFLSPKYGTINAVYQYR